MRLDVCVRGAAERGGVAQLRRNDSGTQRSDGGTVGRSAQGDRGNSCDTQRADVLACGGRRPLGTRPHRHTPL